MTDYALWVCGDCRYLIAYGEAPGDLTEEALAGYLARHDAGLARWVGDGQDIVACGEHHCDEATRGQVDCECESDGVSYHDPCGLCGTVGVERFAATVFGA
jgi:hypothetical protein